MKKTGNAKNIKIETTMDLWDVFEKATNLQNDFYDKELEKQLRKSLILSDTVSIKKGLMENKVSIKHLLIAILTALQPFSQMLSDLLKMFVKASAGRSDCNLRIRMAFDNLDNVLDFDLDKFKQYEEATKQTCKTVETIMHIDLWKLKRIYEKSLTTNNKIPIEQDDISQWVKEYWSEDRWPDFIPKRPLMGVQRLDELTAKCWDIYEKAVAGFMQVYDETKGRRDTAYYEHCQNKRDVFWTAEVDCWTCHFLEAIASTASMLHHMSNDLKKEEIANKIADNLEQYFASLEITKNVIKQSIDSLIEILNLPFWKKRYELYSAWVSTQIVEALQDRDIEFQITNNTLSFSFSGSHLATCNGLCPPLEIWAELRTNAKKLIGNGRKNAIQPDYTLAVAPVENPDNTVIVVECKQYENPSMKNFREAVIDYAVGRPQAVVMLAGYGKIPQKMYEGIADEEVKVRIADFSFMRPGSPSAKEFKEKLRESVLEYYRNKAKENINYLYPWNNPQEAVFVCLSWGAYPKDLDLHLRMMEDSKEIAHIFYDEKGKERETPYAYLNNDVTQGWGPEIVRISRWTKVDYIIEVHNFSGESEDVSFEVEVCCGQDSLCFQRYNLKEAAAWTVFRMNRKGIEILHLTDET